MFTAEDESGLMVGHREIIMQPAPHLGPLEIIESNFAEGRFVGLLPRQPTAGMQIVSDPRQMSAKGKADFDKACCGVVRNVCCEASALTKPAFKPSPAPPTMRAFAKRWRRE